MNGFPYNNGGYQASGLPQGISAEDMMMLSGQDGMSGQSLDDIVNQNAKVIRRQSMPHQYGNSDPSSAADTNMRRISLMNFQDSSSGQMGTSNDFASSMGGDRHNLIPSTSPAHTNQPSRPHGHDRVHSTNDLSLNTNFANTSPNYTAMMPPNSSFPSAHPTSGMEMGYNSPFVDSTNGMSMDYGLDSTMDTVMANEAMNVSLYHNQSQFASSVMSSPMHQSGGSLNTPNAHAPSGAQTQYSGRNSTHPSVVQALSRSHSMHRQDHASPAPHSTTQSHGGRSQHSQPQVQQPPLRQAQISGSNVQGGSSGQGFAAQPQHSIPGSRQDRPLPSGLDGPAGPLANPAKFNPNNQNFPWEDPDGGWPSSLSGKPHMQSVYKNAYSATGFDMLGVLMRVASRPNPEINIGAVDLSCAFVVCDAEKDDFPIVYCSENFERLTGYTKHMILGRNCRFLQSPDGNVAPGIKRKYVDDDSVLYLKNMINMRRESQISLINYRRGGQPFMNLLTMIPISWETDQVKFFVGFQVDLVEQPSAVTNKNADGSYSINYQRGMTMPPYILNTPDSSQKAVDLGQTVPRDDVSAILSTIGSGESDYAKRMWDKVLLENSDDVVHVLSLKGLFQWVSPSALRILEYEPSELMGTALSSVCHPSDIVPVTRELKDTSTGASVNVVYRIRRKNSGYMWFEGHGSLHTEQGKGRKSIIMVGRERPVYTLDKSDILNAGGIGENELWTKMSTAGMFLFVSSNVRQLLDRQPDELIGVSIQSLMRTDSKAEFARILEHARTGKKASVKHELINRRGQVLSAFTTLYPGDATEGLKPTFIVAQTRLRKYTRTGGSARPILYPKEERGSSESMQSGVASHARIASLQATETGSPNSNVTDKKYVNTDGSAVTYGGQNGLILGRQDVSLASDDNLFDELKTTKSSSWQYEIRQLEKRNRLLAEEVQALIAAKKKRKRRKGTGNVQKDCANCHTKQTPEWRRGPSGQRDLCNSCGLRWAKLNGRVSPRTGSHNSVHSGAASDKASKASLSPRNPSLATPMKLDSSDQASQQRSSQSNSATPMRSGDGHAANMEGASGVPAKIEEGVEPE